MMERPGYLKRTAGGIAVAAMLPVLAGCLAVVAGCNARSQAPRAAEAGPESARVLPAVERVGKQVVIVYKNTAHGYADSYGYDTIVYRFGNVGEGRIGWAEVEERRLGGDRRIERWNLPRAGSWVAMNRRSLYPSAGPEGNLAGKPEGIIAEIEGSASQVTIKQGSFTRVLAAAPDGSVPVAAPASIGRFSAKGGNKAEYTEKRPEDPEGMFSLECTMHREEGDVFRYVADGYEPICEVYAVGLGSVLGREAALESIALMEIVMGEDKPLRPLFAYACSLAAGR